MGLINAVKTYGHKVGNMVAKHKANKVHKAAMKVHSSRVAKPVKYGPGR